ncbi:MAG: hypothetical protein AVDCRST_MAG86-3130, partial [uncultured Truepera sp.]
WRSAGNRSSWLTFRLFGSWPSSSSCGKIRCGAAWRPFQHRPRAF